MIDHVETSTFENSIYNKLEYNFSGSASSSVVLHGGLPLWLSLAVVV